MTETTTKQLSMAQAKQLREAGQPGAAVKLLRAILRSVPNHAEANFHLASIFAEQGHIKEAIPYMEMAAKVAPEQPEVLDALAQLYTAVGRVPEALDLYERIIANTPRGPGTVYSLLRHGVLLIQLGRYGDAADDFKWVTQISPNYAPGWHNLGNVMLKLKNREGAVNAFRKALEVEPDNAKVLFALGRALIATGNYEESIERLSRAAVIEPARTQITANQVVALRLAGRHDDADRLEGISDFVIEAGLAPPPGFGAMEEWNGVLREAIHNHPALGAVGGDKKGNPGYRVLPDLYGANATPLFTTLREYLRTAVTRAVSQMPEAPDFPALAKPAGRTALIPRAEVIMGNACPPRASSQRGQFSGYYFCAVPEDAMGSGESQEGWLELGGPMADQPQSDKAPTRLIKPEPGKLVVFPAWLNRRFIPFSGDTTMTVIAFDQVPWSAAPTELSYDPGKTRVQPV